MLFLHKVKIWSLFVEAWSFFLQSIEFLSILSACQPHHFTLTSEILYLPIAFDHLLKNGHEIGGKLRNEDKFFTPQVTENPMWFWIDCGFQGGFNVKTFYHKVVSALEGGVCHILCNSENGVVLWLWVSESVCRSLCVCLGLSARHL